MDRSGQPIGIIVAMDKEFSLLRAVLSEMKERTLRGFVFVDGLAGGVPVVAVQCGIGKVNAAMCAAILADAFSPRLILSTGVAGGGRPGMHPCDVVLGTTYTYHDVYCGMEAAPGQIIGLPAVYPAAPAVLSVSETLSADIDGLMPRLESNGGLSAAPRLVCGPIVTGDWFVDSREKMASILDVHPDAAAVDMESTAIAQVCHRLDIPFASLRVVSDVPMTDSKASQYYDFWNRIGDGSFAVTRRLIELL